MQTSTQNRITNAQVTAALAITRAVAEAIRDMGEVPAGTLYAAMMDRMDLATFESLIATLVRSGLVERRNSHLLVWVG